MPSAYQVIGAERLTGADQLSAVLTQLPEAVKNRIMKDALKFACQPIESAAAKNARQVTHGTGDLAASIAHKVIQKSGSPVAVALIGPSRDYFNGGMKVGKGKSRRGADRPSRYAHLIEYGHVIVSPEKGKTIRKKNAKVLMKDGTARRVPARPFMRPAVMMFAAATFDFFAAGLREGMATELNKLVKKL